MGICKICGDYAEFTLCKKHYREERELIEKYNKELNKPKKQVIFDWDNRSKVDENPNP